MIVYAIQFADGYEIVTDVYDGFVSEFQWNDPNDNVWFVPGTIEQE